MALSLGAGRDNLPPYYWMYEQMRRINPATAEAAAEAWGDKLTDAPNITKMLSLILRTNGKSLSACRLLAKSAGTTDYLNAQWAEAALEAGDLKTAEQQALYVIRFSSGSDWRGWQEQFRAKLDERKRQIRKN